MGLYREKPCALIEVVFFGEMHCPKFMSESRTQEVVNFQPRNYYNLRRDPRVLIKEVLI